MNTVIWPIIFTLVLLFVKTTVDYNQWCDQKKINHRREWILMAILSIPVIICYCMVTHLTWWLAAPISAGMMAFFIWLFFDGLFNRLRGQSWWFTGSEDGPDDAFMDNFLQSISPLQHKIIKIGGFALFTIIYILTY